MELDQPAIEQGPSVQLQGIAAGTGHGHSLPNRDAAVIAKMFENLDGQVGKVGYQQPFPLHLLPKPLHLLVQGSQEEQQPGLPVRLPGADGSLGAAQGQVVSLLVLLDDALKRTVGQVGIPRPQQQQGGQYPAEAAVAVLERMNLQKNDHCQVLWEKQSAVEILATQYDA